MCAYMQVWWAHMQWSEDNLQGSFLSFHQAGSGERTPANRLGSMCHYPSSRLTILSLLHFKEPFSNFYSWAFSTLSSLTHHGWRRQAVAILETFHTRERCMALWKETAAPINDIFTHQEHLAENASLACIWPFRIYSRKQFVMNNLP